MRWLTLLFCAQLWAVEVPVISIYDSINPGTADYIISNIEAAEKAKAPYLILQIDTPGGLLNSTRKIVQSMLGSKLPIVVLVAPKGAQAGSAGALITLAADVAAMAPGTNIGAAHPVMPGNDKIEKETNDKITNDTAAFAESLAKTTGRNTDWARKAVTKSASIIAEEALKENVIDLIANDTEDLTQKLQGFTLRRKKNEITQLPKEPATLRPQAMTVKHRTVTFLADPNIAYLIMSLGGLCIWVELTHPGLIFPGVLGVICILVSLVSFQLLPIHYGALGMLLAGMAMVIAELFVPAFGSLGLGGALLFILGSLYLMDTNVPEFQISLSIILPTAGTLLLAALGLSYLVNRSRKTKSLSGMDSLIGMLGETRDNVSTKAGQILVNGELWSAVADDGKAIPKGSIVVVKASQGMVLRVSPKEA